MEGDDILERLQAGVPFGPRMFEEMTELRTAAIAEIERLRTRIAEIDRSNAAMGYLTRAIIEPLSPDTSPAPDLMGVCAQVGEIATELKARAEAAEQARDGLLSTLQTIARSRADTPPETLIEIVRAALNPDRRGGA